MEGWEIILILAVLDIGLIFKLYFSWKMIKWAWSQKVEDSDKEAASV